MSDSEDSRVLSMIERDLLRELHRQSDTILEILKLEMSRAEFNVFKYKDAECYDQLIDIKKSHNIFKNFLRVTHEDRHDQS